MQRDHRSKLHSTATTQSIDLLGQSAFGDLRLPPELAQAHLFRHDAIDHPEQAPLPSSPLCWAPTHADTVATTGHARHPKPA